MISKLKKSSANVRSDEDDKRTLNTFDDIQEVLSQVEHQVLQTLVELNREQNATASPKKYKRYLEIVQTSLKTIEMIKRYQTALDIIVALYKRPKRYNSISKQFF